MHLGNCLGGFNFFDEDFKHTLETPRCIDHGKISEETVWNTDAKILEVNSKTGLVSALYGILHIHGSPPEETRSKR